MLSIFNYKLEFILIGIFPFIIFDLDKLLLSLFFYEVFKLNNNNNNNNNNYSKAILICCYLNLVIYSHGDIFAYYIIDIE